MIQAAGGAGVKLPNPSRGLIRHKTADFAPRTDSGDGLEASWSVRGVPWKRFRAVAACELEYFFLSFIVGPRGVSMCMPLRLVISDSFLVSPRGVSLYMPLRL